jgi:hypothetical protein
MLFHPFRMRFHAHMDTNMDTRSTALAKEQGESPTGGHLLVRKTWSDLRGGRL